MVSQSSSGMCVSSRSLRSDDRHPPVDEVLAGREAHDVGLFRVVLVDDLADELLEAILECHETGDRAVLVGDEREVELAGLHLAHQLAHGLVLGDEAHPAHELLHRLVAVAGALGADQVLRVGDA